MTTPHDDDLTASLATKLAADIGTEMLAGKNPDVVEQALGIVLSLHILARHARPERPGALHQFMINVAKLMPVIEQAARRDGVRLRYDQPAPKAH